MTDMKWLSNPKNIDTLFEKFTGLLGTLPVILASIAWCVWAYISGSRDFLDVISMVTFIFGELILRGQKAQSDRMQRDVKRDLHKSDLVLKELREQRYQR